MDSHANNHKNRSTDLTGTPTSEAPDAATLVDLLETLSQSNFQLVCDNELLTRLVDKTLRTHDLLREVITHQHEQIARLKRRNKHLKTLLDERVVDLDGEDTIDTSH